MSVPKLEHQLTKRDFPDIIVTLEVRKDPELQMSDDLSGLQSSVSF